MRTLRLLYVTAAFGIAVPAFSFDITAVGVLDVASPNITTSGTATAVDPKVGVGFGGLISVYSTTAFTLESGVISLSRKYALSSVPVETIGVSMLEIPILIRFDLLPIIAVSAGGYVALGMSEVTKTNPITSTTESWDANNLRKTDFGLQVGASLALPLLPMLKAIIDIRYLYGLANLDTRSTESFKFKDIQVLGGVRLAL